MDFDEILNELLQEFHLIEVLCAIGVAARVHNKELVALKSGKVYTPNKKERKALEKGRDINNRLDRLMRKSRNGVCTKKEA